MSNDFYTPSGDPAYRSDLASAPIRANNDSVEDGFDKLIPLTGNANKVPFVNEAETGQSAFSVIHTATHVMSNGPSPADHDYEPTVFFVAGQKYKVLEVRVIAFEIDDITSPATIAVYLDGVTDDIGDGTVLWSDSDPYNNMSVNTVYSASPTNTYLDVGEKLTWYNDNGAGGHYDINKCCVCEDLAPSE